MSGLEIGAVPASPAALIIGDLKYGFQAADHQGWIKLDGRAVAALTASQQAAAASLGLGANLPDAADAYLGQGAALGAQLGANTKVITQANLPNINLTAASAGNHTHEVSYQKLTNTTTGGTAFRHLVLDASDPAATGTMTTGTAGAHTHSVPLGGSDTPLNVRPKTVQTNIFLYLGA